MKKKISRYFLIFYLFFAFSNSQRAYADFWGGDLPLLAQIVANTLQQLNQMANMLNVEKDTLGLLRDINRGVQDALGIIRTQNRTMQAGVLGQLQNPEDAFRTIEQIYGIIPKTSESKLQSLHDQSAAEGITFHNQAFQYADEIDPEAERIKDYSRNVSPAGAGKLTAESLGVLIHVSNQILRTNAAMLKVLSENLALQNRKEKLNSQQFQMQYEGLSSALGNAPSLKKSLDLSVYSKN